MVVNGDSFCSPESDSIPDDARGRIVFQIPSNGVVRCPASLMYRHLQEKGVVAWIGVWPNGYDVSVPFNYYSSNPYQPDAAGNNMLFVAVEQPARPAISLIDYMVDTGQRSRIIVSVQPDVSNWDGFYFRWYVQVPMRWIPTTVFGAAFAFACLFLHRHLKIINAEFFKRFPMPTMRTRTRYLSFIRSQLSIVHLILMIELMTTPIMCAVIGIGGWQSNAVLPYEMTEFFITALSGWGFACDVLSALLWTTIIKETPGCGRDSWFGEFLDKHSFAKVALGVLPVVLDTGTSLCTALHVQILYINQLTTALIMVMQLAVGIQFLVQALKFQKHAWRTVNTISMDVSPPNDMVHFLRRLNRWTLCLSLSMITFVCFVAIGATSFLYTRVGWVVFWSGAGTSRALTSYCRVMLAQPSRARGPPSRARAPQARIAPIVTAGVRISQ
ncbi:hypothetical protein PBRA_002531 [Plasmodiophora brassicae]|uniref:Transmembrane protein n=1 Tax=Plasmodiophora brassicae TaxID=37360 RepID=A0A0G4J4S2_PLABS|nr:hypothetical protein PBRA_002531 [Plasmodiophora brassicae]